MSPPESGGGLAQGRTRANRAAGSTDQVDFAGSPGLVEPRLERAMETQDRQPAPSGHRLDPIRFLAGRHGFVTCPAARSGHRFFALSIAATSRPRPGPARARRPRRPPKTILLVRQFEVPRPPDRSAARRDQQPERGYREEQRRLQNVLGKRRHDRHHGEQCRSRSHFLFLCAPHA